MLHGKKILGICTSRIHSPSANKLVKTLAENLRPHGYSVFVYSTSSDLTNPSLSEMGESKVFELMDFTVIDVVLVMCEKIMNTIVTDDIIRRARANNVPVFTFGGNYADTIRLSFDYKNGIKKIIRHVIEDHGCRDVHFMAGFKGNIFSEERIDAFKEILAENNIPYDDSMLSYGDFWSAPTISATEKLLERGNLPEAIICANDTMALNVCTVMMNHGYRVPEDIIITGFDGIDDAQYVRPTISTCTCSYTILADEITRMLVDEDIANKNGIEHMLLPYLDLAQSCGCVKEVDFDPTKSLAKLNDRFYRYQSEEHSLFSMSANILTTSSFQEIADILEKSGFYDITCVLRPECIDEKVNPLSIPENSASEQNYLLYDTDAERPFSPQSFDSKQIFPDIKKQIEAGQPLIFCLLNFLNVPMGFICFHYHNYDFDNYVSIPQTINIMNNTIGCLRNMRHQKYLSDRMEIIYALDTLTGLYNRNALVKYYDEREASFRDGNEDITFILCDLDRLKYTNDTFGHTEGDYALRAVADALKNAAPKNAMVARWGGDEMVALFTGKFDEAALRENIAEFLENRRVGKPYEITASIGVVTVKPNELVSLDEITKASDKLMYAEKVQKKKQRAI